MEVSILMSRRSSSRLTFIRRGESGFLYKEIDVYL